MRPFRLTRYGQKILNHAKTMREQIYMIYGCGMVPPDFVIKIQDRDGGSTRRRVGEMGARGP